MANLKLPVTAPSTLTSKGKSSSYDLQYRGNAAINRVPVMMWVGDSHDNPKMLKFWVNPSECSWRVATRTTIEQVQGGAIHHEWPSTGLGNQAPSKFDQPVVNFTFQSGLILPDGTNDTGDIANNIFDVAPGLANFYDFLQILHEPNVTANGIPNYVNINYTSSVFPSLHLHGHFTSEGVQWTDTADNPNMVNSWGASFVVFSSAPNLFEATALKSAYFQAYYK